MENCSPQIENGFTRIANELLEAILSFSFSSRQLNVIFAVIRCTYGYNKKSDAVSGYQLAAMTSIDRSHISKTLAELINLNVINRHETGRISHGIFVNEISINKNYKAWITVAKTLPVPKEQPLLNHGLTVAEIATVTVAELAIEPLPKQPTHKDITKDIKDNTKEKPAKVKTSAITLQYFIDDCKSKGVQVISDESIVFKNAEKIGIDHLWLKACWLEFKEKNIESKKKQANWINTFNNCVKSNWYKIWFKDHDGVMKLTSQGRIIMDFHGVTNG